MKIVIFLFLLIVPFISLSQPADQHVKQLLEVTAKGILQAQNVQYNEQAHSLMIGDFIIPIAVHTNLKRRKHQGNHAVEFSLQEGTAITSSSKVDLRKAWLLVEFKSKKSARNFIKLFRKASSQQHSLRFEES